MPFQEAHKGAGSVLDGSGGEQSDGESPSNAFEQSQLQKPKSPTRRVSRPASDKEEDENMVAGSHRRLEIVVSPVRDRSGYEEFEWKDDTPKRKQPKPIVKEVLEEVGEDDGELQYRVRFANGKKDVIDIGRLLSCPDGPISLEMFTRKATSSRPQKRKQSIQRIPQEISSDKEMSGMGSSRSLRTRPTPGESSKFINSTTLRFSDEDDGTIVVAQPKARRLTVRSELHRSRNNTSKVTPRSSVGEDTSSSDAELSPNLRIQPAKRTRATRSRGLANPIQLSYHHHSEDSDDFDGPVRVARQDRDGNSRNYRVHGRKGNRSKIRNAEPPLRAPGEGIRRSERASRPLKNMKELGEDDIYASDSVSIKSNPRVLGIRETFRELPKHDNFRRYHSPTCDACGSSGNRTGKGVLVFCQSCSFSYHQACLGPRRAREHLVTKVDEGDFVLQCRRCIGTAQKRDPLAPVQSMCQTCGDVSSACKPFREKKSARQEEKEREENGGEDPITQIDPQILNNVETLLFRCMGCYRGFHYAHLPARSDASQDLMNVDNGVMEQRFIEYTNDWECIECAEMPAKPQGFVAWRPKDQENYELNTSFEMLAEDHKEYLIKWENKSYFRCTWMPGPWTWGVTSAATRKAFAKRESTSLPVMRTEDAIPEEYLVVDIVLDVKYLPTTNDESEVADEHRVNQVDEALVKYTGLGYEEIVWENAPKPEEKDRWAAFVLAYDDWVLGKHVYLPRQSKLRERIKRIRNLDFETKLLRKSQPVTLSGGELMAYQMEGMNWLLYKWYKSQNAILADEMGLGKTIQLIAFMATMVVDHSCWPFLIVVPNSTCPNWRREIKKWCPSLRVVAYYGSSRARQLAMKHELYPRASKELRCHIVVTSYEAPVSDQRFFQQVPWAGLIVDEGQRLKNDQNLLYGALEALKIPFRILMTGTPLQNNARELFNLIQFLDNGMDAAALEDRHKAMTKEDIAAIHELIKPFFLRRTKARVLTFLPPMAQVIIPVTMTVLQKKLYKSILAKNPELIKGIFEKNKRLSQSERSNLNNILMQLRKCLCHPFVYSRAIEERGLSATVSHRNLVEASSKLQLLEIMLPKLHERGHRVLIFSQFLDELDIIQDFLDGLELSHQRLDGSIGTLEKQKRIDAFNAPESEDFAFVLSTRAGGVGINLATADTVIILDPDFNPHQDIQALSRAHRIGQKKKVLVFQLMTRDTAEEKIVQIGRKKMALDHVLIESMDADDDAGNDLESILKHGASALFGDDQDAGDRDIRYDSTAIDKLLDRSQAENTKTGDDTSAESQFSFARVWAHDKEDMQDGFKNVDAEEEAPDPTVWDKILKEREQAVAQERAAFQETLGRGKRKRDQVDYDTNRIVDPDLGIDNDISPPQRPGKGSRRASRRTSPDSDTDFRERDEDEEQDDDTEEDAQGDVVDPSELAGQQHNHAGIAAPSQLYHEDRTFHRAKLPANYFPTNGTLALPPGAPKAPTGTPFCGACDSFHRVGYCPLKIAGVEFCPLCGLAHYGKARACPHLQSETQVCAMMDALKQSVEPHEYVEAAMKYLRGVKGGLVRKKKLNEERAENANVNGGRKGSNRASPSVAPVIREIVPPPKNGLTLSLSENDQRENSLGRPSAAGMQGNFSDGAGPSNTPSYHDSPSGTAYSAGPSGAPSYRVGPTSALS